MINDKFNNASLNDGFYDNPNDEESFKTYFHPAFCAAMRLELREDRNHLIFDDEFVLNKKPNIRLINSGSLIIYFIYSLKLYPNVNKFMYKIIVKKPILKRINPIIYVNNFRLKIIT